MTVVLTSNGGDNLVGYALPAVGAMTGEASGIYLVSLLDIMAA